MLWNSLSLSHLYNTKVRAHAYTNTQTHGMFVDVVVMHLEWICDRKVWRWRDGHGTIRIISAMIISRQTIALASAYRPSDQLKTVPSGHNDTETNWHHLLSCGLTIEKENVSFATHTAYLVRSVQYLKTPIWLPLHAAVQNLWTILTWQNRILANYQLQSYTDHWLHVKC